MFSGKSYILGFIGGFGMSFLGTCNFFANEFQSVGWWGCTVLISAAWCVYTATCKSTMAGDPVHFSKEQP